MFIEDRQFQEERALYGIRDSIVQNCTFKGDEDGESPLKECKKIKVNGCSFELRYPLWHLTNGIIENSEFSEKSRAGIWYGNNVSISNSRIEGPKFLRECRTIHMNDNIICSDEFAWKCSSLKLINNTVHSMYPFFENQNLEVKNLNLVGKYSFQYVAHTNIYNSIMDTKDAFWHCENVTIFDSVIKGEYFGWYSKNLRIINCKIIGTQPLCYAKGLVVKDCEMIDSDLAFEKSSVKAVIKGSIQSIKNPLRGNILADSVGEIINENNVPVFEREKQKINEKRSI